ncbi:macro domain-containing protein, partial [bacterium]|nr:macro domain-containing protein [bacterium]
SIAFPAISTGIFGYPVERCAQVMLHTAALYLKNTHVIKKVIFCLFDETSYSIFSKVMGTL